MSYNVIVSASARDQIEEDAWWWAENRSEAQASRWYQGITAAIDSLRKNPARFAQAPGTSDFPIVVREMPFGLRRKQTHRIFFSIEGIHVVVYAVRHVSQRDIQPGDLGFGRNE